VLLCWRWARAASRHRELLWAQAAPQRWVLLLPMAKCAAQVMQQHWMQRMAKCGAQVMQQHSVQVMQQYSM
jgi:hypothetical protein